MKLFDASDRNVAPPPPPVRVNGQEIPTEQITREIQNHPAESPMEAREAAARALVVRELLLQEAHRRGTAATPEALGEGLRETDEDALVRQLLDDAVPRPSPNDDECRRFYDANLTRFQSPTIWEPAHILLSADTNEPEASERAKSMAMEILTILQDQPHQFDALAKAHSSCPSREVGGNLGQVTTGQTTPAFEAALEKLQPGAITPEPIQTPYGFHVIHLNRRIDGATLPFEAVREKIADYLADAVFHKAVHQFVALLAGQADIEGVEIERAMSPLVQ